MPRTKSKNYRQTVDPGPDAPVGLPTRAALILECFELRFFGIGTPSQLWVCL